MRQNRMREGALQEFRWIVGSVELRSAGGWRTGRSDSAAPGGVLGIRVEKDSHLAVNRFRVKGKPKKARRRLITDDSQCDTDHTLSQPLSFNLGRSRHKEFH
jgi:hypothetical protein